MHSYRDIDAVMKFNPHSFYFNYFLMGDTPGTLCTLACTLSFALTGAAAIIHGLATL